ncbi:zinc ribbon domain-containing protein [Methylosinus sp. RM1]|uniref:FmdB family zinc ribbon protein n=1 Tax=Methylosinus sp. RM1 TaxID=2583817 RepID=UPI001407B13F|nr:zinc ribbon domain-containing protein [Methylosinus sp. RM1]
MPLYAYSCNSCDKEFETLVRSDDTPACPACGSVELTRQLSLIAKPASGGEAEPACAALGGGGCRASCPAFADCG